MFFLLAFIATLAYSLQGTLMTAVYRRMDTLSAVAYRGLTLGLSMLPVLLLVPAAEFSRWPQVADLIVAAALVTTIGNWTLANACRYLPVGIAMALCIGLATAMAAVWGWLFFAEDLRPAQIGLIGAIIVGGLMLGATRSQGSHYEYHLGAGVANALLCGLFMGSGYVLMAAAARELDPFLVGYCWELFIGIFSAALALLRRLWGQVGWQRVSGRELWDIGRRSALTIVGTGCYALALSIGPIAITTAVTSTTMVFAALWAIILYQEHLRRSQWFLIAAIAAAAVSLKLV